MVVSGQPRDPLKYGRTWFNLDVLQSQILIHGFLGFQGLMLPTPQTIGVTYTFCLSASGHNLTVKYMPLLQGLPSEFSVLGSSLQVAKAGNFVLKCDCLDGLS